MEDELWARVYRVTWDVCKDAGFKGRQFSDREIVLTFLWAVLHDRPISWACCPANGPPAEHWQRRPSPSTMSRRMRCESFARWLSEIEQRLAMRFPRRWYKAIDARPLPIGSCSKDTQAGYGHAATGMAKGYKLYAIWNPGGSFVTWQVHGMNVHEVTVAKTLIPTLTGEGYLVGDRMYDASPLHDLSAQNGYQLVAPKHHGKGLGHRRQSPHRLRSLDLIQRPFGQRLLRDRYAIDRFFGHMSNFGGGLSPLPNWVRTLRRVRFWVQGKIIINAVRLTMKQRLTA